MNKDKKYNIGLDIGSTSIGWAVTSFENNVMNVEKSGVVRWSDLGKNEDKRNARSTSRMTRRRKNRRKRLIGLLIEQNVIVNDILNLSTSEYVEKYYNISNLDLTSYIIDKNLLQKHLKQTLKSFKDEVSCVDMLFNKLNLIIQTRLKHDLIYRQQFLDSSIYINNKLLNQQVNENYILLKVIKTKQVDNVELILILSGYLNRRGNNDYFPSLDNQGILSLINNLLSKKLTTKQKKELKSNEILNKEILENIVINEQTNENLFDALIDVVNEEIKKTLGLSLDKKVNTSIKNSNVMNHVVKKYIVNTNTISETKLYIQNLIKEYNEKNADKIEKENKYQIRNKDQYLFNFSRLELFEDVEQIQNLIEPKLFSLYKSLFLEQKTFYDGPNFGIEFDKDTDFVKNKKSNTPIVFKRYGKDFINETIGWCTFESNHRRCSKFSLSFEVYKIINAFKNVSIKYTKKDQENVKKEEIIEFLIKEFIKNPGLKLEDYLNKAKKEFKGISSISPFGLGSKFQICFVKNLYNFFELEIIQNEIYNIINSINVDETSVVDEFASQMGIIYDIEAANNWLNDVKNNPSSKPYEIFHKYYNSSWDDLIFEMYEKNKNEFKNWANISSYFIRKNMEQIIKTSLSEVVSQNYQKKEEEFENLKQKYGNNLNNSELEEYFIDNETGEFDDLKFAKFVKYLEYNRGDVINSSKYFFLAKNKAVQNLKNKSEKYLKKNKILPVQPINTISNMEVRYTLNQVRKIIWNLNKEYDFINNSNLENIVIEMTTGSDIAFKQKLKVQRHNTLINLIFKNYFQHLSNSGLNAYKFSLILDQSNVDLYSNQQIIQGLDENYLKLITQVSDDISKIKDSEYVDYEKYLFQLSNLSNTTYFFDSSAWQIDHILPISKSKDDSKSNKWFILSKDNQDKAQSKLAFDLWVLKSSKPTKKAFEDHVKKTVVSSNKREKLMTYSLDAFNESHFIAKHLTNTSFAMNITKSYLDSYFIENKVLPVSYKVVNTIKKQINETYKNRNYSLTHHAMDAQIISSITRSDIFRISNLQKSRIKHNLISSEEELNLLKTNENNFIYKTEFDFENNTKTVKEFKVQDINSVEEFNSLLKTSLYPNFYFESNDIEQIKKYSSNLFSYEKYFKILESLLTKEEKEKINWNNLSDVLKLELVLGIHVLMYLILIKKDGIKRYDKENKTDLFLKNIFSNSLTNKISEEVKNLFDLNFDYIVLENSNEDLNIEQYDENILKPVDKIIKSHIIGKQLLIKDLRELKNLISSVKKLINVMGNANMKQKFEFKVIDKKLKLQDEEKIQIDWRVNKKSNQKLNKDTALNKKDSKLENIKIMKQLMKGEIKREDVTKLFEKTLNYIRYFETSSGYVEKSELLFLEVYEQNQIQYFLPIYPVDYKKIVKGNDKVILIPQTNVDNDVKIFDSYKQVKEQMKFIGRYYTNSEIKIFAKEREHDLLYASFSPSNLVIFFKPKNENKYLYNISNCLGNNKQSIKISWKNLKVIKN